MISLDVGTVVTDLLLHHLESAGSKLLSDHLCTTVTLPGSLGRLGYRLVPHYLDTVSSVDDRR